MIDLETKQQRIADLREHAAAGLTMKAAADEMCLSYYTIARLAKAAGIKFSRSQGKRIDFRAEEMRTLYLKEAKTLQEIGDKFKLTRERVRQILEKNYGKVDRPKLEESPPIVCQFQRAPSYVYIVEAQNNLVKIGVSERPYSRAEAINLHSPIPCRLIAAWPGRKKSELKLHKRFSHFRRHNEWFSCEGSLAAFVERKRGKGLQEAIPEWESISFPDRTTKQEAAAAKRSVSLRKRWADPEYRQQQIDMRRQSRKWERERLAKQLEAGASA